MIIGLQHPGSGVGDQLFCYLAARITAERLGVPFTMVGKSKYDSFITVDKGVELDVPHHVEMPAGKIIVENDWLFYYEGKTCYDPEFNFIEDNTIVDGCRIQDERYFSGYPLGEWLKSEYLHIDDDELCIGFRGGEYAAVPELFLQPEYWAKALHEMNKKQNFRRYLVQTDDPALARKSFPPHFEIIHDAGINWRSMRYAKYAVIANSAFYIMPRLLSNGVTIAPRYWARRNTKEWSTVQSYYPSFQYV